MESRSLFRIRSWLGLMPMLGLAAMSCTINADPNAIQVDVDVEQDDDTTDGSDVRSSDGTAGTDGSSDTATAGTGADSEGGGTNDSSGATQGGTGTATQTDSISSESSSSSMTSSMDTTSDSDTECAKVEANFTAVIPSIYVLVDRSGSMNLGVNKENPAPAGQSRWEIVERTLVEEGDPADATSGGVVYRMQSKAKFALATYTANGNDCPVMTYSESDAADELPKLDNWQGLHDELDETGPHGNTPSSEAIDWVWRKIKANPDPNRILVFASDGDPWYDGSQCANYPFPPGISATNHYHRVVEVVEAMHAEGIKTFVISVGSATSASGMDAVARAGVGVLPGMNSSDPAYPENPNEGEPKTANYFFAGASSALIEQAFESVITGARPCKFQLEGSLNNLGSAATGEVLINDEPKTLDDPNGWRINSLTEIELLGEACNEVRTDPNVDLKVSFSCKAFQPG